MTSAPPDLVERWRVRFGHAGDDVLADLLARWSEPHRRYHTLEHLRECLALAAAHPADDPVAVDAALWFHDAVYVPLAPDNEARSADLARSALPRLGLGAAVVDRVARWILATRDHAPVAEPDGQLVLDVDMAILAAPPERFAAYDAQVRAEYGMVPDEAYAAGRRRFIASVLAAPRIYGTPAFAGLEAAARRNLAAPPA